MTEFAETLRHYCRNPRCRSKLPSLVSNPREAFCTRGCYNSFYLHRCLACEGPIERKREDQKVCRKAKCRNAWRAGSGFGRYATSDASKTLDFIDPKASLKTDRPWRIVAGPELSPSALHCATVGAAEAIEAINRTNARHWREYNAAAEERCFIKRHDPPVNIGGYKFPGAPVIDLAPIIRSSPSPANDTAVRHDDSLDIPDFLRRTPLNPIAAVVRPRFVASAMAESICEMRRFLGDGWFGKKAASRLAANSSIKAAGTAPGNPPVRIREAVNHAHHPI